MSIVENPIEGRERNISCQCLPWKSKKLYIVSVSFPRQDSSFFQFFSSSQWDEYNIISWSYTTYRNVGTKKLQVICIEVSEVFKNFISWWICNILTKKLFCIWNSDVSKTNYLPDHCFVNFKIFKDIILKNLYFYYENIEYEGHMNIRNTNK